MKMRSYNFFHTNTKNPGNNLGIFCLITGRPKLNGYDGDEVFYLYSALRLGCAKNLLSPISACGLVPTALSNPVGGLKSFGVRLSMRLPSFDILKLNNC